VVISPETSKQVKASGRGREREELEAGMEGGRESVRKRVCQRIMRNDTAVAGKEAGRFAQSNARCLHLQHPKVEFSSSH